LNEGDTTAFERFRVKADVYVTDSMENQYLLHWHFHDFTINTDSRKLQQLVSLATPVNLTCRVSGVGVLQEFLNWEEVTMCLDEGMKELIPEYALRGDSSAKAELDRLYGFRKSLEALMLRSVRMFHQTYGLGYSLGETVDVPAEIVVAGVPEPVSGVIRKKLVKIDRENGMAVLSTVTFPDRTTLKQALEKLYPGVSIPYYLVNQTISGSVVTDLKTGWIFYTFEQREYGSATHFSGELLEVKHEETEFNQ
jgi:hypothetical protein